MKVSSSFKSDGKAKTGFRAEYKRTIKINEDELIELLGYAVSEVNAKELTELFKTKEGLHILIRLAQFLTNSYISKLNSKRVKNPNNEKQMVLQEIENEALKFKDKFKKRGFTKKFIETMRDKYPVLEDNKAVENRLAKLKKEGKITAVVKRQN